MPPSEESPLRAAQAWFHAAMKEAALAAQAGEWLEDTERLSARERLGIYRRMYWARQREALLDCFPRTAALLGERFPPLAQAYLEHHPSTQGLLERRGSALPSYLRARGEERAAGLASLEYTRTAAFLEPNPASLATLQALDPETFPRARLSFIPAFWLLALPAGTCAAWAGELAEATPSSRGPEQVAVWRKDHAVRHAALPGAVARALRLALDGAQMETVFESFLDEPEPHTAGLTALRLWLDCGWVERVAL